MSDLPAQLAHYRVTHVPTPVGPLVAWLPPLDADCLPAPTSQGIERLLADLAAVDVDELDDLASEPTESDSHVAKVHQLSDIRKDAR